LLPDLDSADKQPKRITNYNAAMRIQKASRKNTLYHPFEKINNSLILPPLIIGSWPAHGPHNILAPMEPKRMYKEIQYTYPIPTNTKYRATRTLRRTISSRNHEIVYIDLTEDSDDDGLQKYKRTLRKLEESCKQSLEELKVTKDGGK
jgi:hypothetical protein